MADYIKRVDALKAATLAELDVDFVIEAIRNIPTAVVVEVVRCKDCKHWERDESGGMCAHQTIRSNGEWFCAGGKRREVQDA